MNTLSWLKKIRKKVTMSVQQINFSESNEWKFTQNNTQLFRHLGGFFSIVGIREMHTNKRTDPNEFVLIDQSEIGILGFITRKTEKGLDVLFQAKSEPGNVDVTQLAPTVQATESNYKRLHNGTEQPYVEYFLKPRKIIHSSLQTEQGTKFYKKRNRNIIIENPKSMKIREGFKWTSLDEVRTLLSAPHILNSDSRSVLCCLFLNHHEYFTISSNLKIAVANSFAHKNSTEVTDWWQNQIKEIPTFNKVPLADLKHWKTSITDITDSHNQKHQVIQIKVQTNAREVENWDQPIINSFGTENITLVGRINNGILELLLQCVTEPGLWYSKGITATLQQNSHQELDQNQNVVKKLLDAHKRLWLSTKSVTNSEEGGRFYQDENIHTLLMVDETLPTEKLPSNYKWFTLSDLRELINKELLLTNELRSVMCLLFAN